MHLVVGGARRGEDEGGAREPGAPARVTPAAGADGRGVAADERGLRAIEGGLA
jgi:hypothetical protein